MKVFEINSLIFVMLFMTSQIIAAPFSDNGNGTITDLATGLVWQKCSWGQTNSDCSGSSASTPDWQLALSNCRSLTLASRTWRLPNVIELQTILDLTKSSGALIDSTAFPATPTDFLYWSSTTSNSFQTTAAWLVSFITYGSVFDDLKNQGGYVRCVSGP
ncbi:Lcl C-terminal domain-containing protein [Leptospira paudalimensis]|uniref:DUF1566 domain-containing protein n=1 Tax=Leptospira paudalimensis TaxID=2950024 RepID=A0ABT3M7I6_9LEPT|nr:DUF1566 domain-containing protein [Leptospira paudalimensis]MCW7504351.1 DUF1566 domain-containing protein [Leptospira paudalimensis]